MNTQWTPVAEFKFSVGPWNLHAGADPFGPAVRSDRELAHSLAIFRELGFDYIQFHDDDAVPDELSSTKREERAKQIKHLLDEHGLKAEFVAPRLWEDVRGVDGPVTSNNAADRAWALERGKRSIDVARLLETEKFVWWPAREGTYIRESKDAVSSFGRCWNGRTRFWNTARKSRFSAK
jgi:xylose isomerase